MLKVTATALLSATALLFAMPLSAHEFASDPGDREPPFYPCDGTTPEMNQCYVAILQTAQDRQARYLQAALDRNAEYPELVAMIRVSDEQFDAYRRAECGAVWESWKDGTIRTVMSLSCSIALTDERTHKIWSNWLTYMDSTPPVLPEPGPTRK